MIHRQNDQVISNDILTLLFNQSAGHSPVSPGHPALSSTLSSQQETDCIFICFTSSHALKQSRIKLCELVLLWFVLKRT